MIIPEYVIVCTTNKMISVEGNIFNEYYIAEKQDSKTMEENGFYKYKHRYFIKNTIVPTKVNLKIINSDMKTFKDIEVGEIIYSIGNVYLVSLDMPEYTKFVNRKYDVYILVLNKDFIIDNTKENFELIDGL